MVETWGRTKQQLAPKLPVSTKEISQVEEPLALFSRCRNGMNARAIDPADWQVAAACRGRYDLFFPPDEQDESRLDRRKRETDAKSICKDCRVRRDCLVTALQHDENFGIWGGATSRERRAMLRSGTTLGNSFRVRSI